MDFRRSPDMHRLSVAIALNRALLSPTLARTDRPEWPDSHQRSSDIPGPIHHPAPAHRRVGLEKSFFERVTTTALRRRVRYNETITSTAVPGAIQTRLLDNRCGSFNFSSIARALTLLGSISTAREYACAASARRPLRKKASARLSYAFDELGNCRTFSSKIRIASSFLRLSRSV